MSQTESITVLFSDLVGSTELSSSLTPEAADEVRRAHFSALRDAIAATGGTEVKNLGDGLMVGFEATAPALSCAVAMQQGIDRHNRKSPVLLAVRIGISTGDVTVEEGDYFGDPVVEAARLCAVAQGGQILTTDIVKGLARRSGHTFTTERELELKGLPEPVVAWEVVWERAEQEEGTSGIPLPPRLPPPPPVGVIVGRAREQEKLKEALKAVASGEPARIMLISGEAGLGKSTLTSSLARDAHVGGAVILYGRCDEDLAVPHRPFVEALGHWVSNADEAVIADVGDKHLSALLHLVPELERRLPGLSAAPSSDPDAERWMLYGAVAALIERASADAPVVLILDDLHWADRPTLQLLRHIVSNASGRLLVLGTYRDVELSASHPLTETLAALTREPQVTRMPLSGLEDDEVVSFVEAAARQELDEAGVGLAHALYQETDGNPFYCGEVLRHLVETRSIVQDETGRWIPTQELSEVGLPDSVRHVIGSRVGRLGEEASRVLAAASVLGQEFDVDLLAQVVGSTEDPVLDVLEAAGSSALVAEVRGASGRFRFTHALVQHTLYDDLGGTRRSRIHRSAAEALEERIGDHPGNRAGELARHWLAATRPQESSKAVTYARLAGESALESLAPAEAIRWFTQTLEVLSQAPDDGQRARCLTGLGEAQRQVGEPAFRETLLEAARLARSVGDVDTLVQAALANNRGFQSAAGIVDAERVEMLNTALDAIGTADSASRARLLALLGLELTYNADYATRRALSDEALALARRLGDPATILDVLMRRWQPVWMPDTVEELLTESAEMVALSEQLSDPVGKFWSAIVRSAFAVQVADIADVTRCHETMDRLASEVGQPILRWTATFQRTWSALLAGDINRAEVLAEEALQMGSATAQPDTVVVYGVHLLHIRWCQGRLNEIADMVVQIASENPGLPSYRAAAALAVAESERDDEARNMLEAEMSLGFADIDDFLLPSYLEAWARVASHLNNQKAAEVLYLRLRPWPSLVVFNGAAVQGAIAHGLGALATILGQYDAAEAHFTHALELHEKLQAPFFIADTQLEWARMLLVRRASGDLQRAETMLTTASDTAQEYGFAAVQRRAGEALGH